MKPKELSPGNASRLPARYDLEVDEDLREIMPPAPEDSTEETDLATLLDNAD